MLFPRYAGPPYFVLSVFICGFLSHVIAWPEAPGVGVGEFFVRHGAVGGYRFACSLQHGIFREVAQDFLSRARRKAWTLSG